MFYTQICYFLGNFSRHTLIKYTPKRTKLHHVLKIISGQLAYAPELPSICVQLKLICISTRIFKILYKSC